MQTIKKKKVGNKNQESSKSKTKPSHNQEQKHKEQRWTGEQMWKFRRTDKELRNKYRHEYTPEGRPKSARGNLWGNFKRLGKTQRQEV